LSVHVVIGELQETPVIEVASNQNWRLEILFGENGIALSNVIEFVRALGEYPGQLTALISK
jgi:hypothetical protein